MQIISANVWACPKVADVHIVYAIKDLTMV